MGNSDKFISSSAAWRYYFPMVSKFTVIRMFREKTFKSSFKPSGKKRSHWYALKSEVREYALNSSLPKPE